VINILSLYAKIKEMHMKNTIGIITLLLISQSVFAEEIQINQAGNELPESSATVVEPAAAMMTEQSGFSRGSVVRSAFTTVIAEREPTENLQNLSNDNGQVMFFTELRDMSGQTAIHRWEYDGKVVAEVEFDVKGPRWRVWSSKSLVPQWTGDWKVSVVNGAGEVISEKNLSYDIAAAPVATPTENTPEVATESMQ
jgi:hypothetical protein